MSKCPVCKFAKCRWVDLKDDPTKVSNDELERVINHNLSFIEMTFSGHGGSSHAEERMFDKLNPYTDEQERRKE